MSQPIRIRPATPTDLPTLIKILIAAFAPGPWNTLLFPPALCTHPSDESDWRLSVTAAQLGRPGHTHAVAASLEGQNGEKILGWAHWVDTAAAGAATDLTSESTSTETTAVASRTTPPGLDTVALARMREDGAAVERLAREALGEDNWKDAIELRYLMIDPPHQRKGVGRLLVQTMLDRAAAAGKAVWVRSTLGGRELYLVMGFEKVGEGRACGERQFAMVKRAGCQ
ncbi:hypothetical protein N0V93_006112 [Gnomoniopsis smithogilvyi]|uniref:N-acetyltransferase domain-containing protein n=1 Tax=Gnomoniopsis smithogilvyi TaxID=1191159 RepID=A0A9W9CU74_9PEZI|nr:hypothetical protein N0V93_006112 [Gnomoniopsis smithogilvyi]